MSELTPATHPEPVTEFAFAALDLIGHQTADELFAVDQSLSHHANAWRGLVGDRLHAADHQRLRDAPTDEVTSLIEPEGMEQID